MKMEETGKPLSETEILKFEKEFKIKLPQDYREFMLEHNGGVPEDDWVFDFVEDDDDNSSVIRDFFVLYFEGEKYEDDDLKEAYKTVKRDGSVPPDLMPIGSDPGGNTILLGVEGKNRGKVYFGNHEWEDEETGYIVLSLIADTFSEFIEKCYIDEEDEDE